MSVLQNSLPAIWAVGGILLGGGLTNIRDVMLRRAEARAVDAALTAEVRALLETIEVRGLRRTLIQYRLYAERLIAAGDHTTLTAFPRFPATWNYFALFEALLPKVGLLPPGRSTLMIRFHVAAKSSCEILMRRSETVLAPMPPLQLLDHIVSEERLADRAIGVVHDIVGCVIVRSDDASARAD